MSGQQKLIDLKGKLNAVQKSEEITPLMEEVDELLKGFEALKVAQSVKLQHPESNEDWDALEKSQPADRLFVVDV